MKILSNPFTKMNAAKAGGGVWLWYEIKAKWEHSERHVPAPARTGTAWPAFSGWGRHDRRKFGDGG